MDARQPPPPRLGSPKAPSENGEDSSQSFINSLSQPKLGDYTLTLLNSVMERFKLWSLHYVHRYGTPGVIENRIAYQMIQQALHTAFNQKVDMYIKTSGRIDPTKGESFESMLWMLMFSSKGRTPPRATEPPNTQASFWEPEDTQSPPRSVDIFLVHTQALLFYHPLPPSVEDAIGEAPRAINESDLGKLVGARFSRSLDAVMHSLQWWVVTQNTKMHYNKELLENKRVKKLKQAETCAGSTLIRAFRKEMKDIVSDALKEFVVIASRLRTTSNAPSAN